MSRTPKKQKTSTPTAPVDISTPHNLDIHTIWVDRMEIGIRSDVEVALLRFQTARPDPQMKIYQEACRIMTPISHIQNMIDTLCRSLNYYPEKPGTNKPRKRKKTTRQLVSSKKQ